MSVVFPIFLAPSIYAADFSIDTTADFDAGTKSQPGTPDGNYEIETETDNKTGIPPNTIELGNKFGDMFSLSDADGNTFKIADGYKKGADDSSTPSSGNTTTDINTTSANKYYAKAIMVGGIIAVVRKYLDLKFTGAFDAIVLLNHITHNQENSEISMEVVNDSNNRLCAGLRKQRNVVVYTNIFGRSVIGGADNATTAPWNAHVWFRIRRDGSNNINIEYDTDEAHDRGTFSWTSLRSEAGFAGNVYLNLLCYQTVINDTTEGTLEKLYIETGTPVAGQTSHRTSGNWTSATQTMPTGERMAQTTIYHSGLDTTNYIDKVEWLVGGATNAVYDPVPGITNGAATCITRGIITSGSFSAVNGDFQIKLYLVGDGLSTLTITKIEGDTEPAPLRTVLQIR